MSEPFVGEIRMFAGNFAPRGWAFCDGQLMSIPQNDALFSLLGTIYGGDGRTTFGLPDMRGRIPNHQGTGPGLSPHQLGRRIGQEHETITTAQLPAHSHLLGANSSAGSDSSPSGALPAQAPIGVYKTAPVAASVFGMKPESVTNTGGSQSHANLMPYLCVNFIIALFGIYPSRQ